MKEKNNVNIVINKKLLYSAISFFIFIILTILVLTGVTNKIDLSIEAFIISIRNDNLTKVLTVITNIGSAYSLISLTFLISLIATIKRKKLPINTIINLISVFIISQIFKAIIRRPRPAEIFLVKASGYSYPSGHTMVSFAFFTFIAYSLLEKIDNKILKMVIRLITLLLVIAIGFSRIYLGVHHFTDVLGGYLLGLSYLLLFLNMCANVIKKEKK